MLKKPASSVLASFRPSTSLEILNHRGAFPFAKTHYKGERPTRNAVCTSSGLRSLRPCLGQGAAQGKESVLADSGREGEITARVGRVTWLTFLSILLAALVTLSFPFVSNEGMVRAAEPSSASLQELGDGLMKNVEEMVAHGGMGDAKAIIHHCGEAARYAEAIIKQLSASGSRQDDAVTSLNEVIRQCGRVSEIGIHADPGRLLNPALKARTAAQESVKLLGLTKPKKS